MQSLFVEKKKKYFGKIILNLIRDAGVTYSPTPRKNEYKLSFSPEKLLYTEIFPRKNEYILNFPPENQIYVNTYLFLAILVFPPLLF